MQLQHIIQSVRGERGQTFAEYGILVSLVAAGVVAIAVFLFAGAIAGLYDTVTACFDAAC
jgi:Flp pilus assembly pilin Flp